MTMESMRELFITAPFGPCRPHHCTTHHLHQRSLQQKIDLTLLSCPVIHPVKIQPLTPETALTANRRAYRTTHRAASRASSSKMAVKIVGQRIEVTEQRVSEESVDQVA